MIKNGQTLFKSYRTFLRETLPESKEVRKITLNPGFSCPNLDGTKGKGGCTYCNNKGFSPAFSQSKKSISKQLFRGIERVPRRFKDADFMAYFQPFSNTYAPLEFRLPEAKVNL